MSNDKWKIAQLALTSRLLLLLAMSLSCTLLPDFHPGDDVIQFDLRLTQTLTPTSSSSSSALEGTEENNGHCFCLQGHGCDSNWKSRRRIESNSCADTIINRHRNYSKRYYWFDRVYAFLLPSVTKWDGARFLTLAVDPWARYPIHIEMEEIRDAEHAQCDDTISTCKMQQTSNEDNNKIYGPSEQSHAFLPLLPLVIRYTANFVMAVIPPNILPLTYEGTVTLCAIIINMVAFVIATIALYELTICLLMQTQLTNLVRRKHSDIDDDGSKPMALENDTMTAQNQLLANSTAQIFCINPAGVFFTAVYSESIFAMLTFAGHAIFAKGQYCNDYLKMISEDDQKHRLSSPKGNARAYYWCWANFYWIPSTLLWMMASFTRSNGSFTSIWLVIVGIAKCVSCIRACKGRQDIAKSAVKVTSLLLFHCGLASLVALPVIFHDWRGYNFHCLVSNPPQQQSLTSPLMPEWCESAGTGRRFSLYAHVQRKYWNVGLFHYYELKQLPNFLLAAPLLTLSFTAAVVWIVHSWSRHRSSFESNTDRGSNGGVLRLVARLRAFLRWVYLALDASTNESADRRTQSTMRLLLGPKFLSHYAILAGFALVGTFIAHVQISTRLICSSCPAIYWFWTSLFARRGIANEEKHGRLKDSGDSDSLFQFDSLIARLLYPYFILYNIIGVILHVNFLPWT